MKHAGRRKGRSASFAGLTGRDAVVRVGSARWADRRLGTVMGPNLKRFTAGPADDLQGLVRVAHTDAELSLGHSSTPCPPGSSRGSLY